ncbi:homocysteine S-methyltransferase [Kineosporia succinea]|uniref:Homocysteine S-methyltransferase n=1 Tax=Kineosporia succinea TaxID=84632 RepID=A0ABT9P1P1_9ACTN|nr:homocysteine S-methyltransferase [Kineosporia succinea]MDP9826578.1 homocysteine S-methyltransferase [Kineosporia succinea]
MVLDLSGRPLVLDGGLSTELERQGHDISGALWSAQLLIDNPTAIIDAHRAFLEAGADIVTTASYQAPLELMPTSVRLAREAVSDAPALVAGSVGPYGATLANGAEYTGDYPGMNVQTLRAFHRPRLAALAEAGVDVLAVETIPSLLEVEALLAELDDLQFPAWLSLTPAGLETRRGEPVSEAFTMAASVSPVVAVGANCTEPAFIADVVARSGALPAVAYPNSGEGWDASARSWTPASSESVFPVEDWIAAGARIIGGCCRVTPAQIREIAETVAAQPL